MVCSILIPSRLLDIWVVSTLKNLYESMFAVHSDYILHGELVQMCNTS